MIQTNRRQVEVRTRRVKKCRIERVTFEEAARRYLNWLEVERKVKASTAARISSSLSACQMALGCDSLQNLKASLLEQFKSVRRRIGITEASLRNDLHAISGLFKWAIRRGLASENPVSHVDVPSSKDSGRVYVVSADEESRYFAALEPGSDLHSLGRLIILTGARPSELLSLTRADCDLDRKVIQIRDGKSKSARRQLFLTEEAFQIVSRRMAPASLDPQDALFPHSGTVHAFLVKLDALHREIVLKLGMPDFKLYSCRHTYFSRLGLSGCDRWTMAKIAGHASTRMMDIYCHSDDENVRKWMTR